jgi:carbamoyl-phosphate synthase small subunit
MNGLDLVRRVTPGEPYDWSEGRGEWSTASNDAVQGSAREARHHVVVFDYGIKRNILRCLADAGCRLSVVPASTTADAVLALRPDGIFLSNGPGDPAAVTYAVDTVRDLLGKAPIFGICLGHQLLALALGAKTYKLKFGHRGANQPVKDLATGRIEITTQNHGFCVDLDSLPAGVTSTHVHLNDGTSEGLSASSALAFSVQYHPEAAAGPHDSLYLFERFVDAMKAHERRVRA